MTSWPTVTSQATTLSHHDGGAVDPSHGDEAPRHVLVAARDGDVGVVPLPPHDRLDRVGDDVARLEREGHPCGEERRGEKIRNVRKLGIYVYLVYGKQENMGGENENQATRKQENKGNTRGT